MGRRGGLLEVLYVPEAPPVEALLFLVPEEYRRITEKEIHNFLSLLLEHQPPNLHSVMSTRTDSPVALTRLRDTDS